VFDQFSFTYSPLYLLAALIVAVLFALAMYLREKKFDKTKPGLNKWLFALRTLSVFFILLLLLAPIIKNIEEEEQEPILILAEDVSESIAFGMDSTKYKKYQTDLKAFKSRLNEKFTVEHIKFGDQATRFQDQNSQLPSSQSTNISNVLSFIESNYGNQNVGAVVLASDGIYNEGMDPSFSKIQLPAPIHTISLGDTTPRKDVVVKNVFHNKIAYLGDQFSIQVDLSAFNFNGSNAQLIIESKGVKGARVLHSERIPINANDFFTTKSFVLDADQVGLAKYSIRVAPLTGESTTQNNRRDFFLEVIDGRQQILLLANAPHPDLGALKDIITSNKNYEVQIAYPDQTNISYEKYDLVILHNLPSIHFDIADVIKRLDAKKIARLFIAGSQIQGGKFNASQNVVSIRGESRSTEDVEVQLAQNFSAFTLSEPLQTKIVRFPPLVALFGTATAQPGAEIVFFQKIKRIPTSYPLLAYARSSEPKTGVLMAEGIWRWRMQDLIENKNKDIVSEVVTKSIQLLTVKDDKRKFRVQLDKNVYKENEAIRFDAQLYNDAFELINEPDPQISIFDENKKEYKFAFSKISNYYQLNAGFFPEGSYTYKASVNHGGTLHQVEGSFSVAALQLEQFDLVARHRVMASISKNNQGNNYRQDSISSLVEMIEKSATMKPVIYYSATSKPLIHVKWLFALILLFLSLEWFLRRYFGSY